MWRCLNIRRTFQLLALACAFSFAWGCGDEATTAEELAERQRSKEIEEAKQLAEKLRNEKPMEMDEIQRKIVQDPGNVCKLDGEFRYMDMGPDPDFFWDGSGAAYHDKWTNLYFRDFLHDYVRRKFYKGGRNPSWNKSMDKTKVIFELFKLNPADWGGVNEGIAISSPFDGSEPQVITTDPGSFPFFCNNDTNIIYRLDDKYVLLDEKLEKREITQEEYERLVNERYSVSCNWKVSMGLEGFDGVWVSSLDDRYHCQVLSGTQIKKVKTVPGSCQIYAWNEDSPGLITLKQVTLPKIQLSWGTNNGLKVGDSLQVFAVKLSPLTGEEIGFDPNKYRSTIRVVSVEPDSAIAEYQTRLFRTLVSDKDKVALSPTATEYCSIAKLE